MNRIPTPLIPANAGTQMTKHFIGRLAAHHRSMEAQYDLGPGIRGDERRQ
jgi:hypothetical protein